MVNSIAFTNMDENKEKLLHKIKILSKPQQNRNLLNIKYIYISIYIYIYKRGKG